MQIHQIGGFMNQKMKTAPAAENKMGTMPIGKLLFNMSLPMMISMLVQALYNIVDSIFVAKLSENALTAVSLAFPLQTLLIAVATGTGVGMNALLSKALGERRSDEADKIAVNTAFIYFLSYLVFLIVGFTICKTFLRKSDWNRRCRNHGNGNRLLKNRHDLFLRTDLPDIF